MLFVWILGLAFILCRVAAKPYDYSFRKLRESDIDSTLERVNVQRRKLEGLRTRLGDLSKMVSGKFESLNLFTRKYLELQRELNERDKEIAIRQRAAETIKEMELKMASDSLKI